MAFLKPYLPTLAEPSRIPVHGVPAPRTKLSHAPWKRVTHFGHKAHFLAASLMILTAKRTKRCASRQAQESATLPPLQRLQRSLRFYSAIIPVLGQYIFRPWLRTLGVEKMGEDELIAEMDDWGSKRLQEALLDLGGFYVKTGQVLSTRVDLFSKPYTSRLRILQDSLPPVDAESIREIVSEELCGGGDLSELIRELDDEPLGTASIAQVHRGVLNDGREVAIKVLRPHMEPVLRGDVANLKLFALTLRGRLPVDYYPVFCELERALDGELDFLSEAQSALKVAASIRHNALGKELEAPLVVPLPIPGMATRKVLVMDFIKGTPLSKLEERAKELGIDLGSSAGKALGRRILEALTTAYGRMVFSSGFIHGDPHPGNIFVLEGGKVALIDCGQVAQLFREQRLLVAEAVLAAAAYDGSRGMIELLAKCVRKFGVTFFEGQADEDACAASVALYLFGEKDVVFPGGYSKEEFSDKSPLRQLKSFPMELVLLGRASVLVKGVAARLDVAWSVAKKWAPLAKDAIAALCSEDECRLPAWALSSAAHQGASGSRLRFRDAARGCAALVRRWGIEKAATILTSSSKEKSKD
ncbi:Uncharacterized protein in hydrogenase 1 5'region (Fragment) [Durusdinium trenchii]|uniref:Uncharacterized protein in hydrogenase 1 5'region n=1 Tax=Durusdinium trenchii TaxID=1381693 RepID=A0ABP0LMX1_9DINO